MQNTFEASLPYAQLQDENDELRAFKNQFYFPQHKGKDVIYFCGNSLGLQPKTVEATIETELKRWRELGVDGWFKGPTSWMHYADAMRSPLGKIMGAREEEITLMNALTVNLHLLMLTFYKPTKQRYKILMEAGAFPSDQYAVETQVEHYGLKPQDAIIEVAPRKGEKLIQEEDILSQINEHKEALSLVLIGGINYYTGQLFDIKNLTQAAHEAGAYACWDLAHVAGNVPVRLHDWNVDFAVWCNYKYLNGGPGAIGGAFIHEQHSKNKSLSRFGGWWGNDEATRFEMEKGFVPKEDASGWNISTAQVFNMTALKASLEFFDQAGIEKLREKSIRLTGYLEFLLQQLNNISFEIITPEDEEKRGAQLCLYFHKKGKEIYEKMLSKGIIVDYREPGVIRVAPAPFYCSFADVFSFYKILKEAF
ncbi:MAG: kynureninase [Ilyomonas sp.]